MHFVNELCYTHIISIYLHTFCEPNNVKIKPRTTFKSFFAIKLDKLTDKYSTLDMHGA